MFEIKKDTRIPLLFFILHDTTVPSPSHSDLQLFLCLPPLATPLLPVPPVTPPPTPLPSSPPCLSDLVLQHLPVASYPNNTHTFCFTFICPSTTDRFPIVIVLIIFHFDFGFWICRFLFSIFFFV